MRKTDYDVVFLGCSVFAIGCSTQFPEKCLIIEKDEFMGGEFTDALMTDAVKMPEGQATVFYDELIARHITDFESAAQGKIHLPAVNVLLNKWILDHHILVRFRTRVISIERQEDRFVLTCVCNAQIETWTTRKIIDTRSEENITAIRAIDKNAKLFISCHLYAPEVPETTLCSGTVQAGYLSSEAYWHVPVQNDTPHNREHVMRLFENRPRMWMKCKLLTVQMTYAVTCKALRWVQNDILFIPGCSFGNPVTALTEGLDEKEVFAR